VLQVVIDFFNNRLDSIKGNAAAAPEGQASWNVNRVLELVQTFAQVQHLLGAGDNLDELTHTALQEASARICTHNPDKHAEMHLTCLHVSA
jgi:hypothetical protein